MDATAHWGALDRLFGRILTGSPAAHARERLGRRAAALSEIYLRRISRTVLQSPPDHAALARQLAELQQTHRALTSALAASSSPDKPAGRR